MAESCSREASTSNESLSQNNAIALLANQIKDAICDANPLAGTNNLYADLLIAAISEVDWWEIAKSIIEEIGS